MQRIIPAVRKQEGRGAQVMRLFPTQHLLDLDPFVLLDDFSVREPAGFPRHPHRGFEAFTYMLGGAFHHQDNLGNDSVVGPGGIQRFTSGRGAFHSEMPASRGENRGLQLWVNLPKRLKQMAPSYAATDPLDVPEADEQGVYQRTVLGSGAKARLETAVDYFDLTLEKGRSFHRQILPGSGSIIYVISGSISLMGELVRSGHAALPTAGQIAMKALEFSQVLYLSGKAHHEPIVHNGPFVD